MEKLNIYVIASESTSESETNAIDQLKDVFNVRTAEHSNEFNDSILQAIALQTRVKSIRRNVRSCDFLVIVLSGTVSSDTIIQDVAFAVGIASELMKPTFIFNDKHNMFGKGYVSCWYFAGSMEYFTEIGCMKDRLLVLSEQFHKARLTT